jgi:hypothetical protein
MTLMALSLVFSGHTFAEHVGSDAICVKKCGTVGQRKLGGSSSGAEVVTFSHLLFFHTRVASLGVGSLDSEAYDR